MRLMFPVRRLLHFHNARQKQRETPYYLTISGRKLSLSCCGDLCFLFAYPDSAANLLFACQDEELIRF